MNRQTLTIGAGLLALVIVAFGIAVYLERGGSDDGASAISGPGRAAEAREIIADIQQRRANEGVEPAGQRAPARSDEPESAAGQAPDGGAAAVTPSPSGADAATPAASSAASAGTELDAAFERARALQAAGQLDDAQVLYFFGARQGHAPSAFAYAEMNDPNHHSAETSLLAEPDAFQAFRWYSVARDGGMEAAAARLDALHEWAKTAAEAGDTDAERLLLQWE